MSQYINNFQDKINLLEDAEIEIPPELQSIMLLSSLPEDYENFCVAIESRNQIPTVDFIKGKLIEEEARRQEQDTKENGTSALVTRKAYTNKGSSKYVHKGPARGDPDKKKFEGNCFNCGKYEHPANHCRIKRKDSGKPNKFEKTKDESEASLCAVSALANSTEGYEWYLDSGATSHMCNNRRAFESLSDGPISEISTAGRNNITSRGVRIIRFNVKLYGKVKPIKLTNVLYVPELRSNLLSVPAMTDKKYEVKFAENKAFIISPNKSLVFTATKRDRIYTVMQMINQEAFNVNDNNLDLRLKV